ncbi:hypothetical protein LTR53_019729, partial [Teratosphaeriaceae sp. CCFEE 6253]
AEAAGAVSATGEWRGGAGEPVQSGRVTLRARAHLHEPRDRRPRLPAAAIQGHLGRSGATRRRTWARASGDGDRLGSHLRRPQERPLPGLGHQRRSGGDGHGAGDARHGQCEGAGGHAAVRARHAARED